MLWEESIKFCGSIYSRWTNGGYFGFSLQYIMHNLPHPHTLGGASVLHMVRLNAMQYAEATWRISMKTKEANFRSLSGDVHCIQ